MIRLFSKHFLSHWRLNALHFLGFVLCAGILASLPQIFTIIASTSLARMLDDVSVPNRNIVVSGSEITDTAPPEIALGLGDLFKEAMAVRETRYPAYSEILHPDGTSEDISPVTIIIDLWSFDQPEERFSLVGGRYPGNSVTVANLNNLNIPVIEAVIGEKAAESSNLVIGDSLAASNNQFLVRIVGIVSPIDPESEIWWGDDRLTPFNMWRRVYTSPDIDEMNISLILHPETMAARLSRAVEWRVIIDREKITTDKIDLTSTIIQELQGRLSGLNLVLKTGLLERMSGFKERLSEASATLFLLSAQSFLAVIYILSLIGDYSREQSQDVISTMASRGFSRLELTSMFAFSSGVLALTAWPTAVISANLVFRVWNLIKENPFPVSIPASSWWFALGGIVFGWIMHLVKIYRSTRCQAIQWQDEDRFMVSQYKQANHIWDIMLLIFGALTYWQFSQTGRFSNLTKNISETAAIGASDPVLLLGPTLLILASGVVLLRVFPYVLQIVAGVFRHVRGLIFSLSINKMARQPTTSTRAILLISMTAGLTFFATVFNHSLNAQYEDMAAYKVGADLRVRSFPDKPGFIEKINDLPGIAASTQVYRGEFNFQFDEFQEFRIDLLAVEPDEFSQVAAYPDGLSPFTMPEVMHVLDPEKTGAVPLVISDHPIHRHLGLHDELVYELGPEEIAFDVSGIIVNFPLVRIPFAIANLSMLRNAVDLNSPYVLNRGEWEQWIKIKPGQYQAVYEGIQQIANEFSIEENVIKGDANNQVESFLSDLISQEATAAFQLNALMFIPLSVIGFLLIQIFSGWKRKSEWTILQKLGASAAQFRRIIIFEWVIAIIFGMGIGAAVGYGLTTLMAPFHSNLLEATIGVRSNNSLAIPWDAVGIRFFILLALYGFTIFLSNVYLQRGKE